MSLGLDDISQTQENPPTPLSDEKPDGQGDEYDQDNGSVPVNGHIPSPQSNPVSYGDELGLNESEHTTQPTVDLHLPQLVRLENVLMDEICAVNDNVDQLRRDFEDIKVFIVYGSTKSRGVRGGGP